jgi:hypothetical protein
MENQYDRDRRDQLLDQLQEAADEWGDKEEARIENEVTFLKSVLKGRTGSERLAASNSSEGQALLSLEIDAFLTGGS